MKRKVTVTIETATGPQEFIRWYTPVDDDDFQWTLRNIEDALDYAYGDFTDWARTKENA